MPREVGFGRVLDAVQFKIIAAILERPVAEKILGPLELDPQPLKGPSARRGGQTKIT